MSDDRLRRFAFDHLPEGQIREASAAFCGMAEDAIHYNEGDPLLDEYLTKLWEAKNLAVLMVARPYE